jgi:hypothetical protein
VGALLVKKSSTVYYARTVPFYRYCILRQLYTGTVYRHPYTDGRYAQQLRCLVKFLQTPTELNYFPQASLKMHFPTTIKALDDYTGDIWRQIQRSASVKIKAISTGNIRKNYTTMYTAGRPIQNIRNNATNREMYEFSDGPNRKVV